MPFRLRLPLCLGVLTLSGLVQAELPPPEEYLPADTLAYVSVPVAAAAREAWAPQPPARWWSDPAMQPFRSQFMSRLHSQFLDPFRKLTGIDGPRMLELAEGQITFALLPGDTPGHLSPLLVLDAGSRVDALTAFMKAMPPTNSLFPATDSELPIGGVSFQVRHVSAGRLAALLNAAFPPPKLAAPRTSPDAPPLAWLLGQTGSVLIATTRTNGLPAILERLEGPSRSGRTVFPAQAAPGSNVVFYGAINGPAFVSRLRAASPQNTRRGVLRGLPALPRIVDALGLDRVRAVSCVIRAQPEGWYLDRQIEIPDADRRGIFRLFELIPADSTPPALIPGTAERFSRTRLSGPASWTALQRILLDIEPSWLGVVQLFTGYAGRVEDADFDFEKGFIDQLGDDWIRATIPSTPAAPVRLTLVGSTNATALVSALHLITAPTYLATFLPPDAPAPRRDDRLVAGKPVFGILAPSLPWPWPQGATGAMYFASLGDHVALSGSEELLARVLSTPPGTTLAGRADFAQAVAAVGGGHGGHLAFVDERAEINRVLASLPAPPPLIEEILRWAAVSDTATRVASALASWADFAVLPRGNQVGNHFGIAVRSARLTADGFQITTFRPTPPSP